jgi:NitT/TauT family transport system permease protein/sulfonate transport system permease protein
VSAAPEPLAALERRRRAAAHLATVAFVAVWALAAAAQPAYVLPGPWAVAEGLVAFLGNPHMLAHMLRSFAHVVAAISLSFVIGGLLALLAHYVPVCHLMVHGRVAPFLNSFSGIGWALLAVLWFGLTPVTVIFAITMVLVPFAIINLRAGLEAVDPDLLEMARSFGRSRWREFRLVVAPALRPFVFATLRISFGVSWKVALTAELFGGNAGFGYLFNLARQDYDTPLIFVVIVLIVAFVFVVDRYVFAPIQRRLQEGYAPG